MSLTSGQKIKLLVSCLIFFVVIILVVNFIIRKSEQETSKEVVNQKVSSPESVVLNKPGVVESENQIPKEQDILVSEGPLLQ